MTTPASVMEHLPLKTVDEKYAADRSCAVCGESNLVVIHVDDLPDYVKCEVCESAFIISEAADWALFGSISADYPETKQMVLKRWTTLEAVQAMASSERTSADETFPVETAEPDSDSTPPFGIGGDGDSSAPSVQAPTPPFGLGELDDFVAESTNGNSDPGPVAAAPLEDAADVSEPEPRQRYVVILAQKSVVLPPERCAHCLRRPAPRKLLVALNRDPDLSFQVPLCQLCHDRASARSEEQKTFNVVAHLSSILIAGVLIVGALAVGLVNIGDLGMIDLLLLAALGLMGYGLPVVLLLRRSSRMPPTEDAQFVRSTLHLRKKEGLAFGWRNRGYAELFSTANAEQQLGELTKISDERQQAEIFS